MGETTAMRDAEARRALKDDLARLQCRVHQPDDPPLFTREPRSTMEPVHWRWRELLPMQPGDVPRTFADIDAISRDLGYRPSTSIHEGIPAFVRWFKAYHGLS